MGMKPLITGEKTERSCMLKLDNINSPLPSIFLNSHPLETISSEKKYIYIIQSHFFSPKNSPTKRLSRTYKDKGKITSPQKKKRETELFPHVVS